MRESKETLPDFLKIFNERLQSIEPATGEDAKGLATWYDDPEITEIRREVPAVFFDSNNLEQFAPPVDIWIENSDNLDRTSHYIHDQVVEKLGKFLGKNTMPYLLAGYILENSKGERFLVLDDIRAGGVRSNIERHEEFGGQEDLALLDVLNKYKISKVVKKTSKKIVSGDTTSWVGSSEEVIEKSMLDKRREDMALINIAKKHGMTNSQYLRLVTLAKALFLDGKQVSLEEIAKSIVEEPYNENISVKHLSFKEK